MDQLKVGMAMLMVAAIIVWIGGAYALDAWRRQRLRATAYKQLEARSAAPRVPQRDEQSVPPAEAA